MRSMLNSTRPTHTVRHPLRPSRPAAGAAVVHALQPKGSGLNTDAVFLRVAVALVLFVLTTSAVAKDLSAAFRVAGPDSPMVTPADYGSLPGVFAKPVPETVEDLASLESHVTALSERLIPATICIATGNATGSGVIISPDGWVLTAGHVFDAPNRNLTIIFPDGSTARGRSFGHNDGIDSGLCKITESPPEGGWPHVEVGDLSGVSTGDYVLAIGHPGGFDRERPYVVRLGRMLQMRSTVLQTDAIVVGGDSGGPLFDMNGRVIGIHSRINTSVNGNYHIPIDTYLDTWDRLAAAERWGGERRRAADRGGQARLGVEGEDAPEGGARITGVLPGTAASDATLAVGDVIVEFNGREVSDFEAVVVMVSRTRPGDEVVLTVRRGGENIRVTVTMGRR